MREVRGLLRIYKCDNCQNAGIEEVESEDEVSTCSLCDCEIIHQDGMSYVEKRDDAMNLLMELVMFSRKPSTKGIRRGIGVRKRVFYIVESIVDMNRGRPATLKQIMNECTDASIPPERATHFLNVLKSEGVLVDTSDGIIIEGEVI
ncbi:MAG: hypothetical protein ACTSV2_06970 [Candidatus Thorarchaeota archaeon]